MTDDDLPEKGKHRAPAKITILTINRASYFGVSDDETDSHC